MWEQELPFDAPTRTFRIGGLSAGPRVVRAYFRDAGVPTSSHDASEVHELRLRPGLNLLRLRVDRNRGS